MKIKAIIFDFFGVISTEVTPLWFEEHFGKTKSSQLKQKYMSSTDNGDATKEELFYSLSLISNQTPEEIEADFSRRAKIDAEMVSLIERLKANYKIALLSNAQGEWLEEILQKHNLNRLFDVKIISSFVHCAKPKKEIYELTLSHLNLKAAQTIFIDDNPQNVQTAKELGLTSFIFTDITSLKNFLEKNKINI